MLLDPDRWSLAQSSDQVLPRLSDDLSLHTSPETHAAVVELFTGIHPDADGAAGELASLRNRLGPELRGMGLTAAAAGTHPLSVWEETEVLHRGSLPPARRVDGRARPTRADDGAPRARRCARTRRRHPAPQRSAAQCAGSTRALGELSVLACTRDRRGTGDGRSVNGPGVAPLVALIQSLARLELEGDSSPRAPGAEVLAENRFLAARDGMNAWLIDPVRRRLIPAREMLEALVASCRPHAIALGCAGALDRVEGLASANGADRQRAYAAGNGHLEHLVASLADRFLAPDCPTGQGRST
jgi:gamma-glutamyl:cysteine ligase YbdK (ATP-grasp superfamily)